MMQGGDIEHLNGQGGMSIYGKTFSDESFYVRHKKRGYISMANQGKDTNGSQFLIIFKQTKWLDGLHVVFGRVCKNIKLLDKLENADCNGGETPNHSIRIIDCGEI